MNIVQIIIRVVAHGIDVPLWVERPHIDMKICMYDRLYQDSMVIHNRFVTLTSISASSVCFNSLTLLQSVCSLYWFVCTPLIHEHDGAIAELVA